MASEKIRPRQKAYKLIGARTHGIRTIELCTDYRYPQGHPCHGCPYTFPTDKPSCTMGGEPEDCPWTFYKRLMQRGEHKCEK